LSDSEALEIALIENIQREDLTAIEEAAGYQRLIDEFKHTQEALAQAVGKSRSHVANLLRLLTLPEPIREMVNEGVLSAGHARALVTVAAPEALAKKIVRRELNVRQTERLVRKTQNTATLPPTSVEKDPNTAALEENLTQLLGLKVSIETRGEGGNLKISYKTLDQLDGILQRLTHGPHRAGN
jgi:ParB family chromosome partitioning protein